MQIEQWPIARLLPYDRNPRRNDHAVESVAKAIQEFGFRVPILARSSGEVIDGHLRLKAAKHLGLAEVPVLLADDMTDAQVRAFRISVNRMAELADWDSDLLAVEIADLDALGFDLGAVGFDAPSLGEIGVRVEVEAPREVVEDEPPEPPADPITRRGDLWRLGDHRLLCGDSTCSEDVARLMAGERAALVHADPPYFGKADADWDNDFDGVEGFLGFTATVVEVWCSLMLERGTVAWWCSPDLAWHVERCLRERVVPFNHVVWTKGKGLGQTASVEEARRWRPTSERLLLCEAKHSPDQLLASFNQKTAHIASRIAYAHIIDRMMSIREAAGVTMRELHECLGNHMAGHYFGRSQFEFPTREAWDKMRPLFIARGHDLGEFDAARGEFDAARGEFDAARREFDAQAEGIGFVDVWEFPSVRGEDRLGHPTPKPLVLTRKILGAHARDGDLVAEPFLGSGTTLIAAEQLGRRCYGMEISPAYCDVIVKRWESLTGRTAVLERSE